MTDHRPPVDNLAAERVNEMSRNFWNSAVLRAGIKLNVFSMLEHQALSGDDVAQACGANRRFMEAFLEACTALGLLDKQGERYTDSAQAAAFLVPDKPTYVGDLVLHITNYWHTWGKLDQLIKEGRSELPFENGFVDAPTYWTDYMRGQHNRATAGQNEHLVKSVATRRAAQDARPRRRRRQLQHRPVRRQPGVAIRRRRPGGAAGSRPRAGRARLWRFGFAWQAATSFPNASHRHRRGGRQLAGAGWPWRHSAG